MTSKKRHPTRKPAETPEERENQLINLAMNLAEKQMLDGTATSQVVSHFLKLGSTREQLERERLERENELLHAKVEALASAKRVEDLYAEALEAMRSYSGKPQVVEEFYDD